MDKADFMCILLNEGFVSIRTSRAILLKMREILVSWYDSLSSADIEFYQEEYNMCIRTLDYYLKYAK